MKLSLGRPPRELALGTGLLAASVVVTLAALEAGLRLGGYERNTVNPILGFNVRDAVLGHRGHPNYHRRFTQPDFVVDVEMDEQGFRVPLRPRLPTDERPRVLVFGDSFTWGWGVSKGEVFTDHLAEALPRHQVRNLGISNVGTVTEFRLFETGGFAEGLTPADTVLVMFFRNDFEDNVAGSLRAGIQGRQVVLQDVDLRWAERLDRLRARSFLFNFLSYRSELFLKNRRAAKLAVTGPETVSARVTRHYLSRFRDVCSQKRARFLLVEIPDRALYGEGMVNEGTLEHGVATHRTLLALGHELGVEILDLLPAFQEAKSSPGDPPLTFPRDPHWNANGHRLVGRCLAERLGAPPARARIAAGGGEERE